MRSVAIYPLADPGTDARWIRPPASSYAYTLGEKPPAFPAVQWLEDEAVVRGRWNALKLMRVDRAQTMSDPEAVSRPICETARSTKTDG